MGKIKELLGRVVVLALILLCFTFVYSELAAEEVKTCETQYCEKVVMVCEKTSSGKCVKWKEQKLQKYVCGHICYIRNDDNLTQKDKK